MKVLKKALPALAVILAAVCASGCNTAKSYGFYTNMPDGYEISDKNFTVGELIKGYIAPDKSGEAPDCTGYTTKGRTYFYMMTDATVAVSADFEKEGEGDKFTAFLDEFKTTLSDIDQALSTSVTNSDISRFNAAAAGEKIEISQIAYDVLSEAKAVYDFTDHYYNPALYYNIFAYGFGNAHAYPSKASELPKDEVIAKYTDLD